MSPALGSCALSLAELAPYLRGALLARAGGRCECMEMTTCWHHPGQRCPHELRPGISTVHCRETPGPVGPRNMVALCERCSANRTGT